MENRRNGIRLRTKLERLLFKHYPSKSLKEICEMAGVTYDEGKGTLTCLRSRGVDIVYETGKEYIPLDLRTMLITEKETILNMNRRPLCDGIYKGREIIDYLIERLEKYETIPEYLAQCRGRARNRKANRRYV